VGAVDSCGFISDMSSPGPTYDQRIKPEVCARGVFTWCPYPFTEDDYWQLSGTSMSTPLVSGSVALILQAHPGWSPVQVRRALMETGDNTSSPDNDYGWGVIDVAKAIEWSTDVNTIYLSAAKKSGRHIQLYWRSDNKAFSGYRIFRFCGNERNLRRENLLGDTTIRENYFVDNLPFSFGNVRYQVEGIGYNGHSLAFSNICSVRDFNVTSNNTTVKVENNPFNPYVRIKCQVINNSNLKPVSINLSIFDVCGNQIRTLFEGDKLPGDYIIQWNGKNNNGRAVSSGVYFLYLKADNYQVIKKLLLLH
jgi:hypothetical protein